MIEAGEQGWEYDGVDVGDFLIEQFKIDDLVESLDENVWRQGRILEVPRMDEGRAMWKIRCSWSEKEFYSEHLRPLTENTDSFETLMGAFKTTDVKYALKEAGVKVLDVAEAWPHGRRSVCVKVSLSDIREAQVLRDQVLSGELERIITEVVSRVNSWEIGLEKSAFFEFYEGTLLSLSDLTEHQEKKLQALERIGPGNDIHLSAAAGCGKTFVAIRHLLNKLVIWEGPVLYVAPNKALVLHFLQWLLTFAVAQSQLTVSDLLARLMVMFEPFDCFMCPSIEGNRLELVHTNSGEVDVEFLMLVIDESHHLFCSGSDCMKQEMLKKIPAGQKLLLSDLSQSSTFHLTFDEHFPHRHCFELTEVVRSTQRIVAGATAFQVQGAKGSVSSLGTNGPPLKTFIFEAEEDRLQSYVRYTMQAFWHIIQSFAGLSLHRRLALLVRDEKFCEDFKPLLEQELKKDFPHKNLQLITCEESLSYLPAQLASCTSRVEDGNDARETIILDTITNAKGVLVPFCLDVVLKIDFEIFRVYEFMFSLGLWFCFGLSCGKLLKTQCLITLSSQFASLTKRLSPEYTFSILSWMIPPLSKTQAFSPPTSIHHPPRFRTTHGDFHWSGCIRR